MEDDTNISSKIEQILAIYDPMQLIEITNRQREYRQEAKKILKRINSKSTVGDIFQIAISVFVSQFYPAEIGDKRRDLLYLAASDIYILLNAKSS